MIVGGGSHGLATAYYLRQRGITDVAVLEKSYIGSGAAGRNTTILRSNYKTPEGARFYDASREALRGAVAGARLQPAVLAVRPPDARPHRPRDVRHGQPRRGQPPDGHRLAAHRPRRGPGARAGDGRRPTTPRIRSSARSTTRRAGSSATTRSSGASPAAPTRAAPRSTPTPRSRASSAPTGASTRVRTNRGTVKAGVVLNCTAGWSSLISDMAGVPAADHDAHPAGVRDRADEAAARRGDRVLADARLHLADRPRRVPHGRGDRAVDDLPDAGHAELPAGGQPPHARAVPAARARAPAAGVGRACAT